MYNFVQNLLNLLSDLYRHTLKTVNTHFKFLGIQTSWARTNSFSLWLVQFLHRHPSSEGLLPLKHSFDLRTVKEPSSETLLRLAELVVTPNC